MRTFILLLLAGATVLAAAETWPGVKVTYFKGKECDERVLVAYERELRHDNWVPLPLKGEGRRRGLDAYSVRYECLVRVDAAGEYVFRPSDRGAREGYDLEIDGKTVAWTTYDNPEIHHGKKRIVERPISEPITLRAGTLPLRLVISDARGRGCRDGRGLLWRGPGFDERPLSPARLSVRPWPGMRRRPLLRFVMVGHSNAEGRCGGTIRAPATTAQRAWYYDKGRRVWHPMNRENWNHTAAMTAMLSKRYPEHYFGGMMLGKAASNVCDQWREGQILYLKTLRAIRNTEFCGPIVAMGSHFDWDEMKKQHFVDAFEKCHADLIRRFRVDLEMPELPWIFTRVSPCFSGSPWDPGPGRGSDRYRTLYRAADRIAKALPPMGIVTTDDFINGQMARERGVTADCGPEGDMHYTNQGFRKWAERAMPHLDRMRAVERAIAKLDVGAQPYPDQVEVNPRWPVSGDPEQVVLAFRGEITRVTTPRTPAELLPQYPDALMAVEYRILPDRERDPSRHTEGDPYLPERIVVVLPSETAGKVAPAASFAPGMRHVVLVASWAPQPEDIRQMPLDDDIQVMALPLFYGLAVAPIPEHKRRLWRIVGDYYQGELASLIEPIRVDDRDP